VQNPRLAHITDWRAVAIECEFSCEAMAKRCGVSLRTLERFFQKRFHQTPRQWLQQLRILIAGELLDDPLCVKEIAARVGYHPASLTRLFTQALGQPPTALRFG
jgi:AraC family transcriptional regulator, glycine betaine-responsive activator